MDAAEFREFGKKTIDWIVDYKENLKDISPITKTEPGYLAEELPANAPIKPEAFERIFDDFQKTFMKGVTHWNHPQFHGYFPAGNAYTNIIADALNAAIASNCFSWTACPAGTELETIVLDWFARAIGIPECFMTDKSNFVGGGCFQGSASEATLLATFAARARSIDMLRGDYSSMHDSVYLPHLIVYTSREAHSSVEKACKMALIQLRILDTDELGVLHGDTVEKAIRSDLEVGLIPCMVVATLGTTGLVAFDDLKSIGEAIKRVNAKIPIWLHADGAYGGNTFICPEFRHFMEGLDMADSFMVNPNKLMLAAFDMTCFFVRNQKEFKKSLIIDPAYLERPNPHPRQIDYRNFSVPLSRRIRALKLWFLMRSYGIEGLQKYVRNNHAMAKYFKGLVEREPGFEVFSEMHVGLVGFRFKDAPGIDANKLTQRLVESLYQSKKLYVVPTKFQNKTFVRFSVNYEHSTEEDIDRSWAIIKSVAKEMKPHVKPKVKPGAFSFFRSVSKEVYDRQNSHPTLMDGATPICVLDTDDIMESLRKASINGGMDRNNNGPTKL